MSGRGGKRRQVLQLGSASKLHRYGYSKGFHTSGKKGKGSLPVLVGNYSNSDSEDSEETEEHAAADLQEEEEIIASDTPDVTVNQEQPADMDDELKSFLSEIEAIPVPMETDTTEQPSSPMEDHKTEPEKAVEANLDAEIPVEPAQEVQKPIAKPKQSSHHYSMFVKGESEFVHSPKQETEDVKSPAVLQDKDIPNEPTTNWQMVKDEHTQYYYYWNTVTNEVTWEIPTEYTQYLLLHREYEEKVAKYTPEQLQKLKEKHAMAAGSDSGDGLGDASSRLAQPEHADKSADFHSSQSSTTQGLDGRLSQGILNTEHANGGVKEMARSRSVSPRPEAGQDSKHHKHKKEKKSHHKKKHKRRHDDSQSDEDRHSPKVPDPKKPPVLSSESSVVSVLTGSRLTSIVPYLSDEDDSDEDNNLDPVPQLQSVSAPAADSLDQDREENPTHKEKSTKEDSPQPELSSPPSQDSSNSMAVVAFQSEPTQTADAASSSPVLILPQPSPPPKEEEADDQTQEDNPDLTKSIILETDQPSPGSDVDLSKHKLDTDADRHVIDSPGSDVTTQLDDQEINKIMSAIVDPISATQAADETHNGTKLDSSVVTHRIKEPLKSRPKEVIDMFADDFPVPLPTPIKDVTPVVKGSSVVDDHIKKSLKLSENVTEEGEIMEMSKNDVHMPEKEQQVSNIVLDDSLQKTSKTQENSLDKTSKIKEGSLEKSKTEENSQEKTGKMQEDSLEKTSKTQENSLEKASKTQENRLEKTGKTPENSLDKMSKIQETDLQRESKTPKRSLEKRSRSQENMEKRSKTQESSSEKRSKIQEERSEKKSKSRDDNKDKSKSRSQENSTEKSLFKTLEKSRSRTQGSNSEKIRSRTPENNLEKGRSKTRESGSEKSRSKTQENSSEKGRSRTLENSSEKIRSKTQERNSEKSRHKIRENSSEKIRSKTHENRSEKSRNKARENSSDDRSNFVEKKTLKNVNIVGYASDDEEEEDIVKETVSNKAKKPTHIQQKDKNKESKKHKKDSKKVLSSSDDINLGREMVSKTAAPEVTSEATTLQVLEKQPEKVSDDDDVDFDIDDIDRALEVALEKKLEKKKIELQAITDNKEVMVKDETIGSMTSGELVPGQVLSDTPGVQIKGPDNGSETEVKPNSTIDPLRTISSGDKVDESSQYGDVKLLADIKDMAELALSKLEFLDISTDNLSRLQVLFIELQTRFTDWAAGGLSTQYFHGQLKTAEDLLEQYELSAVPEGWACQWDRSNNRYYYRNKVTDSIQWEYPEQEGKANAEAVEQPTAENSDESGSRVRERASDEHHRARSSGSSRHRRRDEKEKSKHDRHSSSRHYHRKRRRGRDHSNSSDSSSESQHRRHRKSKKKKKHRSERSPSVEIVDYMDDDLDEVEIIDAPVESTTLTPQSASWSPSTVVPPASPPPASPTAADASTAGHQTPAVGTEDGPDGSPSGTGSVQDGLDADLDGFPLQSGEETVACDEDMPGGEFADGTAQEEAAVVVNPAVISKPPQIVIHPQIVAALNSDTHLIAELHSTTQIVTPAQASFYPTYPLAPPTDQAPPTAEMATESSEASLEATKKKKKDKKSLATGSSIMMKKKHMSSMVQKWQKVKIEVEKEDRAKELRQAAIRKKIEELKNTDKSDK